MGTPAPATPEAKPTGPLADRPELALDTEVNEIIRRKAIHVRLSSLGLVTPQELKKWLYKDVLRAYLDDPLLGLGSVLTAYYPFDDAAPRTGP